jgi:hypothetical protein
MKYHEHELQKACFTWMKYQYPRIVQMKLFFAIPNARKSSVQAGARLKAEGVVSGVADCFLSVPNKKYHGLYIEVKWGKNTTSPEQKIFIASVTEMGYKAEVVYSIDEFMEVVNNYL